MSRETVEVTFEEGVVEREDSRTGEISKGRGLIATCDSCEHSVSGFGTGDATKRYCFAQLRETCPQSENNYYEER